MHSRPSNFFKLLPYEILVPFPYLRIEPSMSCDTQQFTKGQPIPIYIFAHRDVS
jgi:hypothetical protein